jgi:hypothetical protein
MPSFAAQQSSAIRLQVPKRPQNPLGTLHPLNSALLSPNVITAVICFPEEGFRANSAGATLTSGGVRL